MNEDQLLIQSLRAIPQSEYDSTEGWVTHLGRCASAKYYLLSFSVDEEENQLIESMWYEQRENTLTRSLCEIVATWIETSRDLPLLFHLYPEHLLRLARWLVWGDDNWVRGLSIAEWERGREIVIRHLSYGLHRP